MANSFPCWEKFKGKDLHKYLMKKTGIEEPSNAQEIAAYKKAAEDFQKENINNLNNIYSDLGLKDYKKIEPPKESIPSVKIGDEVDTPRGKATIDRINSKGAVIAKLEEGGEILYTPDLWKGNKEEVKQVQDSRKDNNTISEVINDYEENHTNINTLVDDIEAIADETNNQDLKDAVKYFRDEVEYDRSISGRHDMTMVEDNFVKKVKANEQSLPKEQKAPSVSGVLKDVNDVEIKEGDTVTTKQPSGGVLPPGEPVTGVVEKTKDSFGNDALQIKYRKEGQDFDRYILLNGKINEVVSGKEKINQQGNETPKSETDKSDQQSKLQTEESSQQPPKPPKETKGAAEGEGEDNLSGIKKALVSEDIIKGVDLDKIGDKEMMSLGRKILDTGDVKPEALVTKIITDGKGVLTPTEVVGLITYKRDIDNSLQDTYKKLNEKKAAGEDIGTLGVEAANLERQIHDFDVMSVITAQQQSMAFRLRQKMLDREYNVVTQIEKYKANNNGVIPPEVEAKFRKLDKELQEVKAKLAEAEKKATEKEGQDAVSNIKESVDREKTYTEEELDKKIQEGVESEIAKLYEELPTEKKGLADKAIAALEKFRAKLKGGGKTYEATLGIPVAIADLGAATAIRAIKVGKSVVEAVRIGIKRIKDALKEKGIITWEKEAEYTKELTDFLESEGISTKKQPKDKPTINEDGTVSIPNEMLRGLVKSGITDINELTDAVHKEVVKDLPDITKRQVRDYITDYGKKVNPTADALQTQVNTAKRVGRLLSELEDLQNKKRKEKNPSNVNKITDKERELKRQINSLIKDTFGKEEKTDEQKLFDAKERTKIRIDDLTRKLRNKDFAKPVKKIQVTDTELQTLNHKKELLQEEYEKEQYKVKLKNRTWWQKAEDFGLEIFTGISRTLVAGFDLSAGLVQGSWRWFTNPKLSARATVEMFKQFASEKRNAEWFAKLKASGAYEKIKQSKLAVTDEHGKASVKEGLFITNWANKIYDAVSYLITGGYKPATRFVRQINPLKASQRAFDGYVNYIRVAKFLDNVKMAEKDGYTIESNPEIFKGLADHVNTTTGRASIGALENSSKWLSIAMFAPRKVASEIKLFTPYAFLYYGKMPKYVRQKALLNFATFLGSYVSINAGIWAANQLLSGKGLNDEDDHFWDITSSDFMTHKFGNTRINVGGGAKSALVFMGRLFSGKFTDQYGKTTELGDRFGKQINTRFDLALGYLKGKASPGAGAVIKKLDERKGLEVDDAQMVQDLVIPMWLQDSKELYKEHPVEIGTLFNVLSIFGANVRTVDPSKSSASKTRTIQEPKGTHERKLTPEEDKQADKDIEILTKQKIEEAEKIGTVNLTYYGHPTISDGDEWSGETMPLKKLTPAQLKKYNQELKEQAGREVLEKIKF